MNRTILTLALTCFLCLAGWSQTNRIFDADTREPLKGVTIRSGQQLFISGPDGSFPKGVNGLVEISHTGYETLQVDLTRGEAAIALQKKTNGLQEVVVSANRDAVKRTQAPIAIASISARTIKDTRATTIDQLLNKVSGVYMVNLGNEQHSMSMRQPMGTRAVYMYLEDGVPVRTSGVFNHNALMEINMTAVRNIEVIKGPASSLYGGEAIGGAVNFITQSGTAIPTARLSLQGNNLGYRRADLQTGFTRGRFRMNISGYHAARQGGFLPYSDFSKSIITLRSDYQFNPKTVLENSLTYMKYYSDMNGGVDSLQFAQKTFTSQHTFTWRKMDVARFRSTLIREWNPNSKSTLTAVFRSNTLDMNPSFRVRDDYRRQGNRFVGRKDLAHGEISVNAFNSYVLIGQHRQKFDWLQSALVAGASLDYSPNTQDAHYIQIRKDSVRNQYVDYTDRPDSMLTSYRNNILNYAAFVNLEFSPIDRFRVVAALRYDVFHYGFNNHLLPSAFSGSRDTVNAFSAFAPKVGFTYSLSKNRGVYANYSRGFVPPQVSELYRGVSVPDLRPSIYDNYELGGWASFLDDKLTVDFSLYRLMGNNTIISVRFDDGSFGNANAGRTRSQGLEWTLNLRPMSAMQVRFSGSYGKHVFLDYVERGTKFNGNQINAAPRFTGNAEITYRPVGLKGARFLLEWQGMSSYYMDQSNIFQYQGFNVFNARAGYQFMQARKQWLRGAELWVNVINVLDAYYAVNASRSAAGRSYTLGEPRSINIGLSYDFGSLFTTKHAGR